MRHSLLTALECDPVIPALKTAGDIVACQACSCPAVFVLCGDILNIGEIIHQLHTIGKRAVIHADLVTGLAAREVAVDFLQRCGADGIISTRPTLVRRARELGLLAVLRMFAIDSKAVGNLKSETEACSPDMVEVLPGAIPHVIERLKRELKVPLIAGGLLETKQDVMAALKAGALCVSTSDSALWGI